jgi:hypothetical protein
MIVSAPQRFFSKEEEKKEPKKPKKKKTEEESKEAKDPKEPAPAAPKKKSKKKTEKAVNVSDPIKMYTLKFNSPILPFAKFPLTQNKYIQEFLKRYEEEEGKIDRVIGVHFKENSNINAENSVGIEV